MYNSGNRPVGAVTTCSSQTFSKSVRFSDMQVRTTCGFRPVFLPQDSLPTKTSAGPPPVRVPALHFHCSPLGAPGYHKCSCYRRESSRQTVSKEMECLMGNGSL